MSEHDVDTAGARRPTAVPVAAHKPHTAHEPGMRVILITGGARSGKSRHAERLAARLGGDAVTFVATGRATDAEMAKRIERHRQARPAPWTTVEAPTDAGAAVRAAGTDVVLLDCLTLLAANALTPTAEHGEDAALDAVRGEVDRLLDAADVRGGTLIVVTNEVGLGIVPGTPLGRWFRDALGAANQRLAARADDMLWMVSGIPVAIKRGGPSADSPPPPDARSIRGSRTTAT